MSFPSINARITDFRISLAPAVVDGYNWRENIRFASDSFADHWGDYKDTTALNDLLLDDTTTHAREGTPLDQGGGPASDVARSVGDVAKVDIEANAFLFPGHTPSRITFVAKVSTSGSGTVSCSYEVQYFLDEEWHIIDSGTFPSDIFFNPTINIVSPLPEDAFIIQVLIHAERALPTPSMAIDLFDFRIFEEACVPPTAPIGVTVDGFRDPGFASAARFDIAWLQPLEGTQLLTYRVYRVREGTETIDTLLDITAELTFTTPDLSLNVEHCFYVVASNDCGTSPQSLVVCDTVLGDTAGPSNFRGLNECEGEQISLLWELPPDIGGIGGFRIYRDGELVANLGNAATTWIDTAPGLEILHTYELRTLDLGGAELPDLTLVLAGIFACEWLDCTTENEPEEVEWTLIPA
jgi:hypothetical protein